MASFHSGFLTRIPATIHLVNGNLFIAFMSFLTGIILGRVDGFEQDEAESERDERAVILRRLFAPKGDTLEALELADRLFNACSRLVECFREESGDVFSVGSIRDCRAYSALPCSLAV